MAEVYELDKPVGSSFPRLRYYTRQLAEATGRILEPAIGTGRVLVPLTADYRDDHRPRPDSRVWTFHAIRPR